MQEIVLLMQLLQPLSFIAFLVAFVTMIIANRYANQQNFGVATTLILVSAIAATVVLVVNVLAFILTFSIVTGIMCAVWGYFSYYSWSQYRRFKNL